MIMNPIIALRLFFATQSLGLSLWLLRIPEVKATIGLSLIDLSFALFMQPFGVLIGFFIAPAIIAKTGNKKSCLYFGSIFIGIFSLIPMAKSFIFLSAILFASGVVCAAAEVSMNAIAAQMEKEYKRRMMSRFHSFWSIGALIAGGLVTFMSIFKVSFLTQQLTTIPLIVILAVIAANSLPDYVIVHNQSKIKGATSFLPSPSLIILCITPFGALLLEGALMEWTAVFKRDYQGLSQVSVGIIFCSFTLSMTLCRFFGDEIINKLNSNNTILISMASSLIGMLIYAQNETILLSSAGAILVGAGIANIYPMTMTLAASQPGSKEKNVSTVAFVSFTSFLVSAPLIGFMGEYLGLEIALSALAPTSLLPMIYLMNRYLREK